MRRSALPDSPAQVISRRVNELCDKTVCFVIDDNRIAIGSGRILVIQRYYPQRYFIELWDCASGKRTVKMEDCCRELSFVQAVEFSIEQIET